MKPIWYSLLIALVVSSAAAIAGNTGKIAGEIKDQQTGEALVGASIRLEGTSMGAASNLDGYYVILNIPPGKYRLVATAVGYTQRTVADVNVSLDLTTTIDFKLSSAVVEMGEEVVVTATRPMVTKDLTASTAIVGGEQISALPVTEVGQVLALQAGFVNGNLRGGRQGEVAYWIDGVPVTDAFNGSQVVEVNKSLVQELQLISGAFNAEYGQAMSGIVNIATKEGGQKFSGTIGIYGGDYLPDDKTLFPTKSFNPANIRNFEASLSGPVIGEDLTFFANGRFIHFGGYLNGFRKFTPQNVSYTDSTQRFILSRNPSTGRADSALVPMGWSQRIYGQGKLTWRIAPTVKFTGNFIRDDNTSSPYNRMYYFNPDGMGLNYDLSNTFIFQFSHSLSGNTFYTIGGSLVDKHSDYYLYADPFDPNYVHPALNRSTYTQWSYYTGGNDLNRSKRTTTTALLKADLTSQVDNSNMVKAGVEFRKHRIFFERMLLQPVLEQTDINLATASPFIRTRIPDLSSFDHDMYTHQPMEISGYLQDKLEFKNLIINIGLRYDYFEPDGEVLNDPTDPNIYAPIRPSNRFYDNNGNGVQDAGERTKTVDDRRAYWYSKASAKWQISPRLGFSFPITARGIVHFSYGHFFQIPRFERLYENPDFKIGSGASSIVGNADLKPEETINGELGLQQQLTDDISLDLTAFLRDIRGLTGTFGDQIVVFGGSAQYNKYTNTDFGFVKGITLTVNKRFSGGLTATADYTFQIARGSASDPNDAMNARSGGAQPEIQLNPLQWDQHHTLNVTLAYAASSWGVSTIVQYGSGLPYTPRRTTDVTALLTYSQTKPSYFNADVRAYYEFTVAPLRFVAFARVFNIFDIRNETNVYDDTGRAGITIDETAARGVHPSELVNTLSQWFHTPTQYSEPRRIEFGMNVEF
jgi:outer membrane receptor protein involved in Fe transport